SAEPPEVLAIRELLRPQRRRVEGWLWEVLEDPKRPQAERLRVACVLADYSTEDVRWQQVCRGVARALVAETALVVGHWADALKPARHFLLAPLASLLEDSSWSSDQRRTITELYRTCAAGQHDAYAPLATRLTRTDDPGTTPIDRAKQRANVAAALVAL